MTYRLLQNTSAPYISDPDDNKIGVESSKLSNVMISGGIYSKVVTKYIRTFTSLESNLS